MPVFHHQWNLSTDQVLSRGCATALGHVRQRHARGLAQQLPCKMRHRAGTGVPRWPWPGLAFIQDSTLFRSPCGLVGPAVIAKSKVVTREIAVKSLTGSYPRLVNKAKGG